MTTTATTTALSTRRRVIIVGGVIPLLIAVVATAIGVNWLPELPDPIAIHWSGSGPDGFGSAWTTILIPLVITTLFSAFAIGAAWKLTPAGRIVMSQRLVLATSTWMAVLLFTISVGTLDAQRGLSDAENAGSINFIMLIGFAAATVLAVGAWFALPKHDREPLNELETPEPIAVAPGELVTWSNTSRIALPAVVVIIFALILTLAASIFTLIAAPNSAIVSVIVFIVLLLLAATTTAWRVTTDRHGLTVRSILGWPSIRIPLDQITDVAVTTVNPTAEFGGWGWRWAAGGRSGIIMSAGSAIEVTKANGKRFVITVDDAETGAAVLATLRSRQAGTIG